VLTTAARRSRSGPDDEIEVVVQTDDDRWHIGTLAMWTKEDDPLAGLG